MLKKGQNWREHDKICKINTLDYGGFDPKMYRDPEMLLLPGENEFCLNISLKYSVIEDMIWIILVKCTMKMEKTKRACYSKVIMLQHGKETQIERKKASKENNLLGFSKEHKFKLNGESLDDTKFLIQIKKGTSFLQRSRCNNKKFLKNLKILIW